MPGSFGPAEFNGFPAGSFSDTLPGTVRSPIAPCRSPPCVCGKATGSLSGGLFDSVGMAPPGGWQPVSKSGMGRESAGVQLLSHPPSL